MAIACIALLFTGCAVAPSRDTSAMADWTHQQGGELAGARLARLQAVGNALTTQASCTPLHYHLLNSPAVSAYSWPSGDLFVTAGLEACASDEELSAAIAHELGHLLGDGHLQSAVSLRGLDSSPGVEQRADAIGCRILLATGHSPQSLIQVLQKVCAASTPECRLEIQQRMALLRQQFPE